MLSKAAVIVCLIVVLSACCFAQSTSATITGRVTDQTKAAILGARLTVINVDTGVQASTTTGSEGLYTVPPLNPGTYKLLVEKQGFRTIVKPDVVLHVQDTATINFEMGIGAASESITVEGGASMVNSESGSVGTVINRQFVENLPLNGRSFQTLLNMTPGITVAPVNVGGSFSVNGQRQTSNNFMVDGVSANVSTSPGGQVLSGNTPSLTTLGTTQSMVSVDALQEFRVETSTYAAEYGRQPGGQISMVTRSGTNQYHGSAFEYWRNEALDANDWFANRAQSARAPERQNDFGGTLGGPLLIPHLYNGRNRTFFFFSYEGLRLKVPTFTKSDVPSLCLRGLGSCLAGQVAAPAAVLPILNAFPIPNGKELFTLTTPIQPNGLAEFSLGYSNPSTLDAISVRMDHTINSKLTLFARYSSSPSSSETRFTGNLGQTTNGRIEPTTYTVGATWVLRPNMTNDFRGNYSNTPAVNSTAANSLDGAVAPPRSVLIPPQFDSQYASTQVTLNNIGFSGFTGSANPAVAITGNNLSNTRQFNIVDAFSYHRGSHQFKFGVDWRRLTPIDSLFPYFSTAVFANLAQVRSATAGTGSVQAVIPTRPVVLNFSTYGEDTWRLTSRLTLNLGLRWDVNPAPGEEHNQLPVAVDQITNLATMQLAPLGTKAYATTYNNFAPRVGGAYQLRQKAGHETVLRGGFGVFYDVGNDLAAIDFNARPPFNNLRTLTNIAFPLVAANVAPGAVPVTLTPPYPNFFAFDPKLKLPYTLQWNVAVEQALGKNQTLKVTYVGAEGRRLLQEETATLSGATQQGTLKINTNFTSIGITRNTAFSNYDALQVQFTHRLSRGLQALVSYTWAHSLDNDSGFQTLFAPQYGNSAFDARHVFGAGATYDIPAPGPLPLMHAILGHWSMDTNIHAQSALPLTLLQANAFSPIDGAQIILEPNVNPGVPLYLSGDACTQSNPFLVVNGVTSTTLHQPCPGGRRINPAAFTNLTSAQIAAGINGDSGRNQLRGLGAWQVDYAVRRQFKLTDRLNMQFRAEAFNVLNHPNFGGITGGVTSATFGEPTNMLNRQLGGINQLYQIGGPRSLQMALKLQF